MDSETSTPFPPVRALTHQHPSRTAGRSRTSSRIYPPGFPILKPHQISSKKTPFRNKLSSSYRFSKTKTYLEQCFDVVGCLGNGSFGQVLHVKCKETGEEFAVKRALRTFETPGKRYRQLQEALNHEFACPHPNIVRFEKAWEERGRLYIQTELCGANLLEYRAHYGSLLENELWTVFSDTLKALMWLDTLKMLHLDVKPSNIYISTDNKSCKLGDFGQSVNLNKKSSDWADDGDRNYMAPELLNGPPTAAADMYSLGVSMLELSTNVDLEESRDEVRSDSFAVRQLEEVPITLRDHIGRLLHQQPGCRPTAKEALSEVQKIRINRCVFRELKKTLSSIDKDYFIDKDWDFETEDVIHPPSLRSKRKYENTVGTPPLRRRLVFDELEEDELPSPKQSEEIVAGCNTPPVFTRILDFNGSPISPPPKIAAMGAAKK
ncbi:hypothetical protein Q1695_016097 [Nippostrongylus brasiliensis]|nr:hypothetical protein Q1695_016097 [Nippostrongylus brasiliensis]